MVSSPHKHSFWDCKPKHHDQVEIWISGSNSGYMYDILNISSTIPFARRKKTILQSRQDNIEHPLVSEDRYLLLGIVDALTYVANQIGQCKAIVRTNNQYLKFLNDFWIQEWASCDFLMASYTPRPNSESLKAFWTLKQTIAVTFKSKSSKNNPLLAN